MNSDHPFFSVVIPTHGRPTQLAHCLEALASLDYPRDRYEVIIVDDGSETPLDSDVVPFEKRLNLTLLRTPVNIGPAAARNRGGAQSKGDFLAFTDSDCVPARDWLQRLAERFAATPECAIGGLTINALEENVYATASQLLIAYLYSYYNADRDHAQFLTSCNLSLPLELFRRINGFDDSFPLAAAEDRDLCDRWLHHGYRMIVAPEVIVYHAHPLTFRTFWRQHFNYGRGAFHFHRMRRARGRGPVRLEPLRFYLRLLKYPFMETSGAPALLISGLMFCSQVANAAGFFWTKMNRTVRSQGSADGPETKKRQDDPGT